MSYLLDEKAKLAIYRSFIHANLNYCPAVWHACGAGNTKRLELIQKRALRFVFNDKSSSYEELLKKANLSMLEVSRLRTIACEVYKAINNLGPNYISELFIKQNSHYNFRNQNTLKLPKVRTVKHGKNSFSYQGAFTWNSLPNNVRCAENYSTFKRLIKNWTGPSCKCSLCRLQAKQSS